MLQTLPSPYEIAGGGNPFDQPAANIAGFNEYDQYLRPLEGLGEGEFAANWPTMLAGAAYSYARSQNAGWGIVGALAGLYLPRITPVVMVLDVLFSHEGVRESASMYLRNRA